MFSPMGNSNPQDLGNGGTIDGTLVVTGDIQVDGGGSLSFNEIVEGTSQIKVTNTSAFLVEKADGTDVFKVDTTNSDLYITGDLDITGSITNATWTGDVIASAYLDTDTAHLSGTQTFSGAKTFSSAVVMDDTQVIDITNTEALLVRKNSDGGDIFIVDTDSPLIKMGGNLTFTHDIATISSTTGLLQFRILETGQDMLFDAGAKFKFRDTDSSNTTRVAIDSSNGNLSIGTDTATNNLHIEATAGDGGITIHSATNTGNAVILDAARTGTDSGIGTIVGKWDGTDIGYMGFFSGSDTGSKGGVLKFATAPNGGSATVALTIGSDQSSTFSGATTVKTDTSPAFIVEDANGDNQFQVNVNASNGAEIAVSDGGGSEKIRFSARSGGDSYITNAGSFGFGIGTTSPQDAVHIKTTADADIGLQVQNDDTQAFCKVQSSGSALYGGNNSITFVSGGSYTTALTIGTDQHATFAQNINLGDDKALTLGADGDAQIWNDGSNTYIRNNTSDQDIIFRVNDGGSTNTEVMKIDGSESSLNITGGGGLKILGALHSSAITLSGADGTVDGLVFAQSGSIGFLDAGSSYMIECDNDDSIKFSVSDSEKMRVNSSGVLSIGETSPTLRLGQKLTTATGAEYGGASFNTYSANASQASLIDINKSNNATVGSHTAVANNTVLGYIVFRGSDGSAFQDSAFIQGAVDGAVTGGGTDDVPGRLTFWTTADGATGSSERLRIDNAGAILPGADDAQDLGSGSKRFDDVHATNGTIQTSDERLKDNISDSSLGLDFVKALRPVKYKWKDYSYDIVSKESVVSENDVIKSKEKTFARTHHGLIAQEVEQVLKDSSLDNTDFAGLIYDKDSDRYGLRYNELIAPLIKAVQELSARVEELEKK